MAKIESTVSKTLTDHLQLKGWMYRKLHGNMYQTGLPDLFLIGPKGHQCLIEMKGTKKEQGPLQQIDLFERCKGMQVGFLILANKKRARVGVILGAPEGFYLMLSPFRPQEEVTPQSVEKTEKSLASWIAEPFVK